MSIVEQLEKKENQLNGRAISDTEVKNLKLKLSSKLVPDWHVSILKRFSLVGMSFSLDEEDDESGMEADLKWLNPDEVIEESLSVCPGMVVTRLGYLPVASCLTGSGNPYFLKVKDTGSGNPALVRISHDSASGDDYPEGDIEVVCESLSEFLGCPTSKTKSCKLRVGHLIGTVSA